MVSLLLDFLPVLTCLVLQESDLLHQTVIGRFGLQFAKLHKRLRVICCRLPFAEGKLGAVYYDASILRHHVVAILTHLLHDLLPDASHLLEHLQLFTRYDVDRAFARGTLHVD